MIGEVNDRTRRELIQKKVNMSEVEVKRIGFEIAMKGRGGFDTTDPAPKYQLKSLPGDFSGLNLVCYMYVAFSSRLLHRPISALTSPKNTPPQNHYMSRKRASKKERCQGESKAVSVIVSVRSML